MENNKGNEKDTRIVALSNIGKVRKNNEDATFGCITKFGTLLLVADGMGGHQKATLLAKWSRTALPLLSVTTKSLLISEEPVNSGGRL